MNARYFERANELLESLEGSYEHSTEIQDDDLVEWLIDQSKELSNIKRLLNDMRRLGRNGQLFIDGEAYNIQYNRSVDELE